MHLAAAGRVVVGAAASAALAVVGLAAPAVSQAVPCTDIPYYGCVVIPDAQLPATPGVPSNIPVPAWTPSIDLCGPLGQRFVVGNICI